MILLTSLCVSVDLALLCRKNRTLLPVMKQKPAPSLSPRALEILSVAGIIQCARDRGTLQATVLPLLINPLSPLENPGARQKLRGWLLDWSWWPSE